MISTFRGHFRPTNKTNFLEEHPMNIPIKFYSKKIDQSDGDLGKLRSPRKVEIISRINKLIGSNRSRK
jgi:hypothetical protein